MRTALIKYKGEYALANEDFGILCLSDGDTIAIKDNYYSFNKKESRFHGLDRKINYFQAPIGNMKVPFLESQKENQSKFTPKEIAMMFLLED